AVPRAPQGAESRPQPAPWGSGGSGPQEVPQARPKAAEGHRAWLTAHRGVRGLGPREIPRAPQGAKSRPQPAPRGTGGAGPREIPRARPKAAEGRRARLTAHRGVRGLGPREIPRAPQGAKSRPQPAPWGSGGSGPREIPRAQPKAAEGRRARLTAHRGVRGLGPREIPRAPQGAESRPQPAPWGARGSGPPDVPRARPNAA